MSVLCARTGFLIKIPSLYLAHGSLNTQAARPFPVISDTLNTTSAQAQDARARATGLITELRAQIETCVQGGGEKGIARHVRLNKKVLVRERIRRILDPGTELWELCTTAGLGLEYGDVPCGGTVCGVGRIHGSDVMIIANDGTVKGGTFYPITISKQLRVQEICWKNRLACLQIVDTGGAFLPLQSDIFLRGGRGFANQALMSSQGIQQVALVSGLCTAGGAYAPTMSDVAIITHRIGNIYLGGPPLVKAATGEVVTGEELGGATMHCSVSGITDHFAKDEEESFEITRDVVASLNLELTSELDSSCPPLYDSTGLEQLAGQTQMLKPDVYALLGRLLDGSRFLEFKTMFGESLVCGFGRLSGQLVGVLINAGNITGADAQKGGHFVQLCDNRDIPLVFIQNSSNSSSESVDASTLKERAKFIQCQSIVRVPKVTLNVGGAISDENYTMCGPSFDPRFYFMWPGARLLKSDPAVLSDEPEAASSKPRKQLSEYKFESSSAAWAAARTLCDGIIAPGETREVLSRAVQLGMLHHTPLRDSRGQSRAAIRM
ncbi:methylcrotonoyl-CoA carboxylase beta chain, mitochondrial [Eurytemora carolleeae]|uniref:methylcrotonoyl-CoA carboxylase beta chain, mitochondrial n=1 Tax=Eurytemora carolleeae TaxID=1294199 RepID=UPI000C788F39|nr:methylcrotonoyl-CoA carboxylase beta chain, mitochondrial [Eurytemora carolleeae]|eukprot:XP_023321293.1 methylcrotonoyl-CoA carboxylase beta chain, mitochondrial-like [Eurytemora affinis]